MSANIHYKDYNPKELVLYPQLVEQNIAENDPVRIIDAVIDGLNLENFKKLYHERGRYAYHPLMMLKVIIYGYMNNLYSCRKIESALKRDIHFIWLTGYQQPDFNTINRFRNRVKNEINQVFTQLVLVLAEKGFITLDVEYIDGTKIESKANKYTFVWRKSTVNYRAKLMEKINVLLGQIDDQIAQEKYQKDNMPAFTAAELQSVVTEVQTSLQEQAEPKTKEEKKLRKAKEKQIKQLKKHAEKLGEHEAKMAIMGKRNSFSKTDPDATFMHMKEDEMNNGQTKPGYNLQISTENQFITDFGLYPNPTDTQTLISFFKSFFNRYRHFPQTAVADSGYGSEENYRFMDETGIEAYVKYNRFNIEHRPHYVPDPFRGENFYYNEKDDYFVCPMGQHMTNIGTRFSETASGYLSEVTRYMAQRCEGCPLRCRCYKGREERRIITANHLLRRYKKKAAELLTSEEGIKHRKRRCIEPEAVFGQIKNNMAYHRFRHFGKDKVTMDFAFLAIAFNLKKMCSIMARRAKNGGNAPFFGLFLLFYPILLSENRIFWKNCKNAAA